MGGILVIDDDEASRDLLVRRLTRSGYTASGARDGETGIEAARKQRPELVLVDIQLGRIDGWEVIERIREENQTSGPNFISMTAFDRPEFLPRSMALGCRHALSIPYRYEQLLECVADCVERAA